LYRITFIGRNILLAAAFLLLSAFSIDDEEPGPWTENIQSKDGQYAVSVDEGVKRVLVLRSDERALGSVYLRLVLRRVSLPSIELPLARVGGEGPPWRYRGKSWEGALTGFDLEASRDGRAWKKIGSFPKK
jgi:hypothetical protein